jgi:hypothetical protein
MSIRPNTLPTVRAKPLAKCLAAALGLALTAASATPRSDHGVPSQTGAQNLRKGHGDGAAILLAPSKRPTAMLHHVTSCNDNAADPGSLRSIVASPSTVSGDTIDFSQLPMTCSTITLSGSAISVYQYTLVLQGPGSANLTIDAGNASSAFYHVGHGTLYLSDLTIANGAYSGPGPEGGCIWSASNVALSNSIVTHCAVSSTDANNQASGGGVYTRGNLTLVHSTITDSHAIGLNGAFSRGGAAYVQGGFASLDSTVSYSTASASGSSHGLSGGAEVHGNVAIDSSTIAGNTADYFGGLDILATPGATANIVNSTISNNSGIIGYGGVYTNVPLTLSSSTIAFNKSVGSSYLAGLYAEAALTLQNTIIADNAGKLGPRDLGVAQGFAVTGANNIITSSFPPVPPSVASTACPRLDLLASNHGTTRTHGLHLISPAIDQGDAGSLTIDQRGAPRGVGAGDDIGSFERQPTDQDERLLASGFDGLCDQ